MSDWPTELDVDPIGEWPGALAITRSRSNFSATWSNTLGILKRELAHLGAKNARLQIAVPANQFRLDGRPRATAKAEHPGVILTLDSRHGALSYPCDTFTTWQDNVRAIALALEALRKVDRYGVTKRGEQYRGFLAIEAAPAAAGFADKSEALNYLASFHPTIPGARELPPRLLLRSAQRKAHPDHGGDDATWRRVALAEAKLREAGLV